MCGFVWVSGSLVDHKGKILVPGMYKDVAKLTDEETKLYDKIEFDLEEYTKDTGAQRLLHNTKVCFSVSVLYVLWTNYCTLFAGLLFSCTIVKQLSICSNATNLHQVQLYANENCIVFWEWSHFLFHPHCFWFHIFILTQLLKPSVILTLILYAMSLSPYFILLKLLAEIAKRKIVSLELFWL